MPNELDVKEKIREIIEESDEVINTAIKLCLYCMKTQIFLDGNKRASVIFANHYLISHGGGFLVIPEKEVPEFKRLLVKYYEGEDITVIADFMKSIVGKDRVKQKRKYPFEYFLFWCANRCFIYLSYSTSLVAACSKLKIHQRSR